jgi:hypothetical protein
MKPTNELEKDVPASTTPKDDAAASPDAKAELSDQEIGAIAGGVISSSTGHNTGGTNTIKGGGVGGSTG